MSHDFIEAALMRRGGWAIHMLPGLQGSYEESPPSLIDLAVRDRRWCQGNLQHIAVLPARGLHRVSRMHLLTGIGSYITNSLLNADMNALSADQAVVDLKMNRRDQQIALAAALGGGYIDTSTDTSTPSSSQTVAAR